MYVQVHRKSSIKPNANPRIFKGVQAYLSKHTSQARYSPSKRRRRHDGQQRDWLDAERIVCYQHCKVSPEQHLHEAYSHINVLPCEDNILLYNIHSKDTPNRGVSMTMRILRDMTARLFL